MVDRKADPSRKSFLKRKEGNARKDASSTIREKAVIRKKNTGCKQRRRVYVSHRNNNSFFKLQKMPPQMSEKVTKKNKANSTVGLVCVRKHMRRKSVNTSTKSLTYCYPGHKQLYEGRQLIQTGITGYFHANKRPEPSVFEVETDTDSDDKSENENLSGSEINYESESVSDDNYNPANASDLFKVC